jgi:hypothetical protein
VGFVVAVVAVVLVVLVVVVVDVARWGYYCRALCRGSLLLKGSFRLVLVSLAGRGSSWALLWGPLGVLGAPSAALGQAWGDLGGPWVVRGAPWVARGGIPGDTSGVREILGNSGGPPHDL